MSRWRARAVARAGRVLLCACTLGTAAPADADRTNHLFMDETQLLPEGDVELENWLWAEGQIPSMPGVPVTGWIWLGPTVGFTSHLEMSLPVVVKTYSQSMVLDSVSLVARYRLFPREQEDGFQPLLRVEYQQPLSREPVAVSGTEYGNESSYVYSPPELKILLVATYGNLSGVQGTANLGVQLGLPFMQSSSNAAFSALGTAGLGVSVPIVHELRVAAELDGQLPLAGNPSPHVAYVGKPYQPYQFYPSVGQLFLGPSLAWTRGQMWVTFGTLFGLTNNSNRYLPKVLWGITF